MSDNLNGMPGIGAINDTLDWVRNFWGAMKIPGMGMPSMSPDDINKQIADLKAVESWLQMNMNMLRSTIQTLEVQSATLTALQSMSDSFAKAGKGTAQKDGRPPFESPFKSSFENFTNQATPAGSAESAESAAGPGPDPAAFAAQFANPTVWWNNVQEQFSKAVSAANTPPKKTSRKSSAGTGKRSTTLRKGAPKN